MILGPPWRPARARKASKIAQVIPKACRFHLYGDAVSPTSDDVTRGSATSGGQGDAPALPAKRAPCPTVRHGGPVPSGDFKKGQRVHLVRDLTSSAKYNFHSQLYEVIDLPSTPGPKGNREVVVQGTNRIFSPFNMDYNKLSHCSNQELQAGYYVYNCERHCYRHPPCGCTGAPI